MITNFKIFESIPDKKYWSLKNDEFFKVRLYKIGMSIEKMKIYSFLDQKNLYNIDFYFGFHKKWEYSRERWVFHSEDYIFMGEVEIDEEDIKNYQIIKDAEKYNL